MCRKGRVSLAFYAPIGQDEGNIELLASLVRDRDLPEQLALVTSLVRQHEHSYRNIVPGQAASRLSEAGSGAVQSSIEFLLRANRSRVLSLLRMWDETMSGVIGEREMVRVLRELGWRLGDSNPSLPPARPVPPSGPCQ